MGGGSHRRPSACPRSTDRFRFRSPGDSGARCWPLPGRATWLPSGIWIPAIGRPTWPAKPEMLGVMAGFLPSGQIVRDPAMLYIAVSILGATVMPHNLYLHSSIIQTRKYGDNPESRREAVRFATIDSTVALMFALFL